MSNRSITKLIPTTVPGTNTANGVEIPPTIGGSQKASVMGMVIRKALRFGAVQPVGVCVVNCIVPKSHYNIAKITLAF